MRALNQYTTADWLRADPLVHGFKRVRNEVVERGFCAVRPAGLDRFLADHAHLATERLTVAVAFNTPWTIDLLARTARVNLAGPLVIADNSRNPASRQEIERICLDNGVPYIGLPWNPERHPCRSHGISMSWAYRNLVLAWRPKVFAFLDHDLFPLGPFDPVQQLGGHIAYGLRRHSNWGWNLWAGYCMFRLDAVEAFGPSFNHDIHKDLDTGGRNWIRIYRHLQPNECGFAREGHVDLLDPADGSLRRLDAIDNLIHFGGAAYRPDNGPTYDAALFERVLGAGIANAAFTYKTLRPLAA